MEMPTPCQNCGELFDLNDGAGSDKWYLGTVICEHCADIEKDEIETEEEIEIMENNISDAEWTIKDSKKELEKLKVKLEELYCKREKRYTHNG